MRIHCTMEIHTQHGLSWSQTTFTCILQTDCDELREGLDLYFTPYEGSPKDFVSVEPSILETKRLFDFQPDVTL